MIEFIHTRYLLKQLERMVLLYYWSTSFTVLALRRQERGSSCPLTPQLCYNHNTGYNKCIRLLCIRLFILSSLVHCAWCKVHSASLTHTPLAFALSAVAGCLY